MVHYVCITKIFSQTNWRFCQTFLSNFFFLQWENVQIYLSSFWKNWLNFEDLFEWGTRVFPTGGKGLEGWVPLPSVENLLSLLPPTQPHPSPNRPEKNSFQKVVFSFEQSLNDQNNFSSGSHHPIKSPPQQNFWSFPALNTIWKTLDTNY